MSELAGWQKKREEQFDSTIACPDCGSKDFKKLLWTPAWAGSLRAVICNMCKHYFHAYWSTEDEICRVVSTEDAEGLTI